MQSSEMYDESDKRSLSLGDLVIVQLTPFQANKLSACLNTSTKLISDWSLPMRIIAVNNEGTTGTLQCLASGWTTTAHIKRIKILKRPLTAELNEDWSEVINSEKVLQDVLTNRIQRPGAKSVGSASRGQTVMNTRSANTPCEVEEDGDIGEEL